MESPADPPASRSGRNSNDPNKERVTLGSTILLGGFEIDDESKLPRLLHGKIGRLSSFPDLVYVVRITQRQFLGE